MFPPKSIMEHLMQIVYDLANLGVPGAADFRNMAAGLLQRGFDGLKAFHGGAARAREIGAKYRRTIGDGAADAVNHFVGTATHALNTAAIDSLGGQRPH